MTFKSVVVGLTNDVQENAQRIDAALKEAEIMEIVSSQVYRDMIIYTCVVPTPGERHVR